MCDPKLLLKKYLQLGKTVIFRPNTREVDYLISDSRCGTVVRLQIRGLKTLDELDQEDWQPYIDCDCQTNDLIKELDKIDNS